ncbi:gluconolactonase [Sphingobium sp. SCG-1]|uniref:SMP-30/gluconolactonase/LRE family protein n=1 Tax=Sphingobium sp. SCG-1 TaxID=2072936 RepID=UPI000CD67653|nr:SMP-30/gluconolactonase/LRE family protein [Sphingobium sp. SCG-1]AUW57024.1 gluconolactonase [Sphingobium sp. SCG-1]
MLTEDPHWKLVTFTNAVVSEVPIWSPSDRSVYWADLYSPALQRTNIDTGTTSTFPVPDRLGSFGLREGGALLAMKSGIYDLDFASGSIIKRLEPPYDKNEMHFNDGRTDSAGRFIVGANQDPTDTVRGRGHYYRIDGTGLTPIISGITTANGTAFSPDGRTMYTAETRDFVIYAYDYDPETGTPTRQRVFARLPAGHFPDGAAVDSEGGYWIALIGAGVIWRFAPDGVLDRVVNTPTLFPAMVSFGGDDLSTMFLTTSRKYVAQLGEQEQAKELGVAGGIFSWQSDVRGFAEPTLSF